MKNRTVAYSIIQALFWSFYGIILGYVSLYLLDGGFNNSAIGIIIAVSGIVSALLQPFIAAWADRSDKVSLKQIICGVGVLALIAAVALLIFRGNMLLTGGFYSLCIILLQLTTPLVNSLGVQTTNGDSRFNFGIARGMGSVGYAICTYIMGILTKGWGAIAVPASMVVVIIVFIISVASFNTVPAIAKEDKSGENISSGFEFFKNYPRYIIVLAGCILLFISHAVLNSFTFQIVEAKGGNSSQMGLAMSIAAMSELPVLFFFGWFLNKARCDIWLKITGLFFTLKIFLTFAAPSMLVFFTIQPLQSMAWGLLSVSSVYYINAIMKSGDTVKGQAYYNVSLTLGNVIGALVCGRILDMLGVNAMLIFGTLCAFAGALIIFIFAQKTEVSE